MTQQTYGETLFEGISGFVYTPWMPSRGDRATLGIEVIAINGMTLTWNVETKNTEDTDPTGTTGDLMVSDQSTTSAGLQYSTVPLTGFKELYRFKFSTGSSASTSDWVNFRILPPSWQLDGRPPAR